MHTEDKAKTKWCPFARVSFAMGPEVGNHAANRLPAIPTGDADTEWPDAKCIASDCMAWRWEEALAKPKEPRGYCGCAGKC